MLSKENRLTSKSDFENVKENGEVAFSKNFIFSFLKRSDDAPSRFGFIVTNKKLPRAVDRNRAKRVLAEGVRQELGFVKSGYDCVFVVGSEIRSAYTQDVFQEVRLTFEKTRILKNV